MTTDALRISSGPLWLRRLWNGALQLGRRRPRRLRLCESLPLGERRFVAVVEFESERFLLGGTPSSLVLLSRLTDAQTCGDGGDCSSHSPSENHLPVAIRRAETC